MHFGEFSYAPEFTIKASKHPYQAQQFWKHSEYLDMTRIWLFTFLFCSEGGGIYHLILSTKTAESIYLWILQCNNTKTWWFWSLTECYINVKYLCFDAYRVNVIKYKIIILAVATSWCSKRYTSFATDKYCPANCQERFNILSIW